MTAQHWRSLIERAVLSDDADQLESLAEHMAACEEANAILRSKGYGAQGQSIRDVVVMVPHARDYG